MTMACSPIARTLVIAEDARLTAERSCALALPGHHLPVVEGPRFLPPDPTAELVRRNDAAARVRRESIFMTGLSDALTASLASPLKPLIRRISTIDPNESEKVKAIRKNIVYYERELAHFQELARK
jgi:hypothetical protein